MRHSGRSGLVGLVVVIGFVVLVLGFVFAIQVMMFETRQARNHAVPRQQQQQTAVERKLPPTPANSH